MSPIQTEQEKEPGEMVGASEMRLAGWGQWLMGPRGSREPAQTRVTQCSAEAGPGPWTYREE